MNISPLSTRRTTCSKYGSFISNAYKIKLRVGFGIELLVINSRARLFSEGSMILSFRLPGVGELERGDALLFRLMGFILCIEG